MRHAGFSVCSRYADELQFGYGIAVECIEKFSRCAACILTDERAHVLGKLPFVSALHQHANRTIANRVFHVIVTVTMKAFDTDVKTVRLCQTGVVNYQVDLKFPFSRGKGDACTFAQIR